MPLWCNIFSVRHIAHAYGTIDISRCLGIRFVTREKFARIPGLDVEGKPGCQFGSLPRTVRASCLMLADLTHMILNMPHEGRLRLAGMEAEI